MTMVERMARAMCADGGYDPDEIMPNDGMRWRYYAPAARAALSAMMKPNPSMINRFVSRALCVSIHGDGGWSNYASEQWQAMLAAALDEGAE